MRQDDPMLYHKCRCIAYPKYCDNGREIWLGELLEPIPGHPEEKFCLHIKTPYKQVVFGLNMGDVSALAVLCQIAHGMPFNQRWLDSTERIYRDHPAPPDAVADEGE